jgi:hypothetical protein
MAGGIYPPPPPPPLEFKHRLSRSWLFMIAIGLFVFLKPEVGKGQCFPLTPDVDLNGIVNLNFAYFGTSTPSIDYNINIKANAKVTINGSLTLSFVEDAGITIEPGGQLTIQTGATLQKDGSCNYWSGIKLLGDQNVGQYDITYDLNGNITNVDKFTSQSLLLMDGATILDALIGVEIEDGATFEIENSNFINNKIGVKVDESNLLASYRNEANDIFLDRRKSHTKIENCSFYVNQLFWGESDYTNIKLNDFKDCAYILISETDYNNNDASTTYDFDKRGTGIYNENSNILLSSGDISFEGNCLTVASGSSLFEDLSYGIDGRNSNNLNPETTDYTVYSIGVNYNNLYQSFSLKYGSKHIISRSLPTESTTNNFIYEKSNVKWNRTTLGSSYKPYFINLDNSIDFFVWYGTFETDENDYLFNMIYINESGIDIPSSILNCNFLFNSTGANDIVGISQNGESDINITCNTFEDLDLGLEFNSPNGLHSVSLGSNYYFNYQTPGFRLFYYPGFGLQNIFLNCSTDVNNISSIGLKYTLPSNVSSQYNPLNLTNTSIDNSYPSNFAPEHDCDEYLNISCVIDERWPNLYSMNVIYDFPPFGGILKQKNNLSFSIILLDNGFYKLESLDKSIKINNLDLYTIRGEKLETFETIENYNALINLKNRSKGIYLLRVNDSETYKLFN